MTPEDAITALRAEGNPQKAAEMAAYHKTGREVLGVAAPAIDRLARSWRESMALEDRLALAAGLWDGGIFEGRIAAAKLLTQARIRPDDAGAWTLILAWAPEFDGWAIADAACIAGQKRLLADPGRLAAVEEWTRHENLWTRRAALVITLPWAKMNFPKPEDLEIREQVLGWAARYVADRDWFIQKAIAWWIRDLSKHDAARARAFLEAEGARLKSFARREAARYLNLSA
ncbi:DNA alkylation repair protein [Plastorhodobacter daqingensis]|uniref:DNA alkylation repair protein n=1 Tax=Plastorhodobacter daqingensis TaxID=1387281 RepID=A0ABW2UJ29_9RHOB